MNPALAEMPETIPVTQALAPEPEDMARADLYALIANLFYAPPDRELLDAIVAADPISPGGELFAPWKALQNAASRADAETLKVEHETLFVGVGRPPVMLYASYYLAGFLMEKPLAKLRGDLANIGVARRESVAEPEDHIAALCDVMRMLIVDGVSDVLSGSGNQAGLQVQRKFFNEHIKPWYGRLAADIECQNQADFYRQAGAFARSFFEIEAASLEIDD